MTALERPETGVRQWAGLALLLVPTLLASLELTIPNLAMPAIGRALTPSSAQTLWLVDVYGFLLAGSLITMGTLGDRVGRRRLLVVGASAFGVLSAAAAFAPNAGVLIVVRALLGVAGATLMPTVLSLATSLFPDPRQRTTAVSIVVASVAGGTAVGPVVGGWVLQHFWWGMVFLIATPVAAVFVVLAPLALPERQEPRPGRLDLPSAVLSIAAVLGVVLGLKRLAAGGDSGTAAVAVVAGLALGAAFVRRQRRIEDALVDLRLFGSRSFSVSLAILLGGIFVLFAVNFFLAQYLQLVLGLSPLVAGAWTAPAAVGVVVGSTTAPLLARRARPGPVIGGGLLVAALGAAALTRLPDAGGLPLLVTSTVVVSLGLGAMMTLATDAVVASAPADRAGEASALSETAPELGGALGIAVLGSVGTAVFRSTMAGATLPDTVSSAARHTLASAVDAADGLSSGTGDRLLLLAREAFVQGFRLVAAICVVLLLLAAVVAALALRDTTGDHP